MQTVDIAKQRAMQTVDIAKQLAMQPMDIAKQRAMQTAVPASRVVPEGTSREAAAVRSIRVGATTTGTRIDFRAWQGVPRPGVFDARSSGGEHATPAALRVHLTRGVATSRAATATRRHRALPVLLAVPE